MTLEAPPPLPQLIDGPADAPATLLLAHGAGAPMDSPFMAAIAGGLTAKGWRVVRFEFSYMIRMRETGRRQGPDRLPLLQEAFREQVRVERASWPQRPCSLAASRWGVGWPACSLISSPLALGYKAACALAIPFIRPASH